LAKAVAEADEDELYTFRQLIWHVIAQAVIVVARNAH
jgi:hypothetical protein